MKTYAERFEEANRNILDTYTGADGCVDYTKFLWAMKDFAKQADDGNCTSKQLVDIVEKFSNLITVIASVKKEIL